MGGILLNIGAYLTMKGLVYRSVSVYILADVCWIFLAYQNNDLIGMGFIILGTVFGIIALYKMYKGHMEKNL